MIFKKINTTGIIFFLFFSISYVYAEKKYEDNKGGKTSFSHKVDSESGNGYCYTFSIDNNTHKTVYDWQLSFELEDGVDFISKRGFNYKKIGKKYIITGLSWNQHLQIGQKGIQLGFCTKGKSKPKNIKWDDEDEENYYDDEFDCSKMKNKNSCESGGSKSSCIWENNSCKKALPRSEAGGNTNSGTLICEINSGSGKLIEPNLIKNHSFENLQEYNIVKKWWSKIFGGKQSYKGQIKDLADWIESNNNFKIWDNDEVLTAQHEDKFLEIDDKNMISQQIQTKKDTKYKLSFYSIGGDELQVKWNGNIIHQKQNIYYSGYLSWIQHEYIVDGIDGKSIISFVNTKQDDSNCKGKSQHGCNGDTDELEKESQIRIGIDNITLYELENIIDTEKIDLMSLMRDELKGNISNNSCTNIFYGLESNLINELIHTLLNSQDYTNIAQDFLNTVSENSKKTIIKNVTYELIKDKITICHTEEEKNTFYSFVYNETINMINTCVFNNLNTQVQKHVKLIEYLKNNVSSCSQSGNTLTLNFSHHYSHNK